MSQKFTTIMPRPWFQVLLKQKKGKLLKSQCSTLYPCCVPALGEFEGSYLSKTCPMQRYNSMRMRTMFMFGNFVKVSHKKIPYQN